MRLPAQNLAWDPSVFIGRGEESIEKIKVGFDYAANAIYEKEREAAKLFIRVDRVYGKITLYPVCEKAKLLAEIAGTTTLTNKALALAERMGFEIVESATAETLLVARAWNKALKEGRS